MSKIKSVSLILIILIAAGCSSISNVERADLTDNSTRQEYVNDHPEGLHNKNIVDGEITVGMNVYEVIASWGLPNVYMISSSNDKEFWVYYIAEESINGITVYTLSFEDQMLEGWDIDIKRFSGESMGLRQGVPSGLTVENPTKIKKR